ncbi:MAG: squalene--hopene cyclase, partial [Actinobacteria bacterium]
GRMIDPLVPNAMRAYATRRAEAWVLERLNGEDGLGAIFPAMVNALEALAVLGYASSDPRRLAAKRALEKLLVVNASSAYCQPCVSPVWDSALASLALQETGGAAALAASVRALDWLQPLQLPDDPGDWRVRRPRLAGGGWAFQFSNSHYPDLDDTAVVAWSMHQASNSAHYSHNVQCALDWLVGMQSRNGGFASFDVDNTHYYLNEIPFADHGALLDPPTSDVTARVVTVLARVGRPQDQAALGRAIAFLRAEQEADGSWFGRWGVNHLYGTGAALPALEACGLPQDHPAYRSAVGWLDSVQQSSGAFGEDVRSYAEPGWRGRGAPTASQTAWALLGYVAAGQSERLSTRRAADYLSRIQRPDGDWDEQHFTGTGFPLDFMIRYHLYRLTFPLLALGRLRERLNA